MRLPGFACLPTRQLRGSEIVHRWEQHNLLQGKHLQDDHHVKTHLALLSNPWWFGDHDCLGGRNSYVGETRLLGFNCGTSSLRVLAGVCLDKFRHGNN